MFSFSNFDLFLAFAERSVLYSVYSDQTLNWYLWKGQNHFLFSLQNFSNTPSAIAETELCEVQTFVWFFFFGLCVWKMIFMRLVLASSLKRVISKNVKCMFFCFPLKWVLLSIFVFCFHTWEDMHNGVTLRESFRETML